MCVCVCACVFTGMLRAKDPMMLDVPSQCEALRIPPAYGCPYAYRYTQVTQCLHKTRHTHTT